MNRFYYSLSLLLLLPLSCSLFEQKPMDQHYQGLDRPEYTILQRPSPLETYTLPVEDRDFIYERDLQAEHPEVDWNTLDRLYIPGGNYRYMALYNLPERSPDRPLIITNSGGQVVISGDHSYSISLNGGSGWILSGKYDGDLAMGDASYSGHLNGDYPNSPGRYGIFINNTQSSGLSIGEASCFELEFLEIANVGFAGLLIKRDDNPRLHMDSVTIHDLYIHDTEGEGAYIGNFHDDGDGQHGFTNLKIYNNRFIRSGLEGIQLSHMGNGVEVYNNVFLMNALWWKNPFMIYQSGGLQYMPRNGKSSIHHNLFIGGGAQLLSLRFIAAKGELVIPGDGVDIHDNYFSHSRNWLGYLHTNTNNSLSRLNFRNNYISEINYHLDELPANNGEEDPQILLRNTSNRSNPMVFTGNRWQGDEQFLEWLDEGVSMADVASQNTRFSNNSNGPVEPVSFLNPVLPGGEMDFHRVEKWFAYSDLYQFYLSYETGDLVVHNGQYFRCNSGLTYTSTGLEPQMDGRWTAMGAVTDFDDVRLAPDSPYGAMGLME